MLGTEKTEEVTFDDHNHFLMGEVNRESIEKAIRWILMGSQKQSSEHPMKLYINSEGGDLADAFALIDVMRTSPISIATVGMGNLMSSAFLIFAAGTPGRRHIGRNTTIMCHQYSEGVEGKYHDLRARISENKRMNDRMVKLLTECSNLSETKVRSKLLPPSDVWMSANELVEFGIADLIF